MRRSEEGFDGSKAANKRERFRMAWNHSCRNSFEVCRFMHVSMQVYQSPAGSIGGVHFWLSDHHNTSLLSFDLHRLANTAAVWTNPSFIRSPPPLVVSYVLLEQNPPSYYISLEGILIRYSHRCEAQGSVDCVHKSELHSACTSVSTL